MKRKGSRGGCGQKDILSFFCKESQSQSDVGAANTSASASASHARQSRMVDVDETGSNPDDDGLLLEENASAGGGFGEGTEVAAPTLPAQETRADQTETAGGEVGDVHTSLAATARADHHAAPAAAAARPGIILPSKPFQPPASSIPAWRDSRRMHRFVEHWFKDFPWLHFDTVSNAVVCFQCATASRDNLVSSAIKKEPAFIERGYCKWKEANKAFEGHQKSNYHKNAVTAMLNLSRKPITAQLSEAEKEQQAEARVALSKIISTLKIIARQGLAFRGDSPTEGNFMQLLSCRAEDVPELKRWLQRRNTFTSPEIQNELLQIMAHAIQREIIDEIKACGVFSSIMDECRDGGNLEQVSICIRSVDVHTLQPVEHFLGFYETANTTGVSIKELYQDALVRMTLDINNQRGQCYDGGSNMKGKYKGVQALIKEIQPLALYVHCYNHSLNLGIQDTMRDLPTAREALQWVHDVGVIISRSPKRQARFEELREETDESDGSGPCKQCVTRWTVRVRSLDGTLNCYSSVLSYLNELAGQRAVEESSDGQKINISAKARGLHDQLEKCQVYFILLALRDLFQPCEALSKVLQSPTFSVSGANEAVGLTLKQLQRLRTDDHFNLLWSKMEEGKEKYDLLEPTLPRKRRSPMDANTRDTAHHFESIKDSMRKDYFDIIDVATNEIESRFQQEDFKTFMILESALLTPPSQWDKVDRVEEVLEDYGFDVQKLKWQLESLPDIAHGKTKFREIADAFAALHTETKKLLSELEKLLVLLLALPSSAATAERSFSALRRLKNYLRTCTGQARLNHLAILHIYKYKLDLLDVNLIMKMFIINEIRHRTFGSVQ